MHVMSFWGSGSSLSFQLLAAGVPLAFAQACSESVTHAHGCSRGQVSHRLVPSWPNIASKPVILQKSPWSRGIGRKWQGILPFFSLTSVLGMAVICSNSEGLVIASIFTCCWVPFQVVFYLDNNNNLFLSLCWGKQTSFKYQFHWIIQESRGLLCVFCSWPLQVAKGCHKSHQTPQFQFGSLIHPNSRQKVPLRIAASFCSYYHYGTNITRYLMLLLKRLLLLSPCIFQLCLSLKVVIQAASHIRHLMSLFFVPLRRSVEVLGSPRDWEPKMS